MRGKPKMHGEEEMIDEEATFEKYGYYSTNLKPKSNKRVVAGCDVCGATRYPKKCDYRDLCHSCAHKTDESKKKNADAHKGKPHTEEHKHKIGEGGKKAHADDPSIAKRQSITLKNTYAKDPTLIERMSALKQGIPYENWDGFSGRAEYCEKFDEACRERIREKYDRECFLCNKPETDNKRKLSVHHYDMNKNAGCDDTEFKLVPLCMHCHGITHSKMWQARIEYLLCNVWYI